MQINAGRNSTSPDPDGLIIHNLKHLGSKDIKYLTHLYELSLRSANIPAIWKQAVINLFIKAGNSRHLETSNGMFNIIPPSIAGEKETLPCSYRSTPSQLHLGHCKALNRYRADISLTNDITCLSYGSGNHNPPRLFIGPCHVRVASFLSTLFTFDYLLVLSRNPPELNSFRFSSFVFY